MQAFKRTLSVLLAVVMVFGMLTVIPVSAAGTDDSESGAAKEYYQIAVGTTAVISENYRDILGNGTASYDPATSTLTLNNPKPTVSFEMNGFGSAVEAQVLAYGEKASEPKAPTADHCYFGGWFTDKACTKAFDFDTPVMDDLTLYAKWTFKKYTITFVNEDDTVLQQSDVEYGTMPEYKGETPVKKPDAQSYYAFTGWTPAISKVTAEVTYRATFRKNARKLLIGDANGDGKVTVNDVTKIQEYLADLAQLTPDQVIAADTNCDGRVTIDDATNIQKYLAEIIDHLG